MSIYKPCDIRGDAAKELEPELYHQWGRTLGRWVKPGDKFVVGGDTRGSTPELLAALVDGLCNAGVDCVCLGFLPTPMIYHAKQRLKAAACAIVTASHNPAPINGLKWMVGDMPPTPAEVERLRRESHDLPANANGRHCTEPRELDVSFDYVASLQEMWVDALRAQQHVVLDPMHGCWSGKARRYLHAIFPECLLAVIHDTPDPAFGGRSPDCSRNEHLEELCETVYRLRAHLGIAFDGDGDRLALVDGQGIPLTAEETTWVLLQSFGTDLRGQRFVHDVKFSDRVPTAARRLGAEPLVERSGHAFIRARMRESGAAFGAEVSGHYFFADLQGGDDGLFTACRVIAFLERSGKTLAELRQTCPAVFITPDLRVPVDSAAQNEVLSRIRTAWSQFPQSNVDGVRIDLPGGWALVRSSVTEAALTFRFESCDWPGLDDLVRRFCASVPEMGLAALDPV